MKSFDHKYKHGRHGGISATQEYICEQRKPAKTSPFQDDKNYTKEI